MRLRHIELFQAILQTGSLTAAAELLHISQPAVSKSLQHAEQQLGFALFHRVRGKLQPTAEALMLQAPTEQLSSDLQNLRRLAANLRRANATRLRLICTPTLAQSVLPKALGQWRLQYTDTECELATQHTREMIQALLLQDADIGLTLTRVEHPSLQVEALAESRLMAIAPAGWWPETDSHRPLRLQCLAGLSLIGLDGRDGLGALLNSHLQELKPAVNMMTRVQTYQLARQMVAAGQGLALVDPFTALMGPSGDIQVRPLEPRLGVTLYVLRRAGEAPVAAQQALLEQIQNTAIELLQAVEC
ncbi:transcriptional regulator [Oceanisphaera marina]|uniref:Transcriptional regulator n=1 Tax=Oceanisphaera marina TaxID=2017550 RepID=A0ABQ1IN99_9GAMM|nr:LysR substrate-binding domain-containing protein [Oceanisphaera marina]GGB46908.1 transcriptional regulator [Oceanisphaera marina]